MGDSQMTKEEAIIIAKKFFENKELPKTTREWRTNCPPQLTSGKINSLPFTVGDLLREINPNARSARNKITYDLDSLGFINLTFKGSKGTFKCKNCHKTSTAERSTIIRWVNTGKKYCSHCRKSSGTSKGTDYYTNILPENYECLGVHPGAGNTKIKVKHNSCGKTRLYSSRHILSSSYLVCSHCEGLGIYDSIIEKCIVEHLINTYPHLNIRYGVKYSELCYTSRRWVLDVFISDLNLCLEITTKQNGFSGYFENLQDKLNVLQDNGYTAKVVYSIEEVDDIVRSLLKGKEGLSND